MALSIGVWGPHYDVSRKVTTEMKADVTAGASGRGTALVSANISETSVQRLSAQNVLKLDISKSTRFRVQILDAGSGRVIADSQGDQKQRERYEKLVSQAGLSTDPGNYKLKITDAAGNDHSNNYAHALQVGWTQSTSYQRVGLGYGLTLAKMVNESDRLATSQYDQRSASAAYMLNQTSWEKRQTSFSLTQEIHA